MRLPRARPLTSTMKASTHSIAGFARRKASTSVLFCVLLFMLWARRGWLQVVAQREPRHGGDQDRPAQVFPTWKTAYRKLLQQVECAAVATDGSGESLAGERGE